MSAAALPPLHVVVLAGGSGERLWPRSRRARPKPLLPVAGGASLLQATFARAASLAPPERSWLVCARDHARAVGAASGLPRRQQLVEPRGRNTTAAVALAAHRILREDPEALMAVLPADHFVPDASAFARALRRAARAAADAQVLVTLGVRPSRPETGYGYIRLGAAAGRGHPGLHRVARFVEKPDRRRAQRFVRGGRHLWNAGIFVWGARTILDEIEAHAPDVHRALAPLRGSRSVAAREAAYRRMPAQPIDKAVLERSRRVWCLPVSFAWSDVGTWASLAEALGGAERASRQLGEEALLHDAKGNLVWGTDGKLVALLGVNDLAVIDTEDALLIAPLERSGEAREIVARLRAAGRRDLI